MSEKFPSSKKVETPSPESPKPKKFMTSEETEQYDVLDMAADYPALERIQDTPEQISEKIAAVEILMEDFENIYNLEELHAITEFATKDDRLNSPRHPAMAALTPMYEQLQHLRFQQALEKDIYATLDARYQTLKRAVGTTKDDPAGVLYGIVNHDI